MAIPNGERERERELPENTELARSALTFLTERTAGVSRIAFRRIAGSRSSPRRIAALKSSEFNERSLSLRRASAVDYLNLHRD